jgi:hypothetical protein
MSAARQYLLNGLQKTLLMVFWQRWNSRTMSCTSPSLHKGRPGQGLTQFAKGLVGNDLMIRHAVCLSRREHVFVGLHTCGEP